MTRDPRAFLLLAMGFLVAVPASAQDLQPRPAEVTITNAPGKAPNAHPMYVQLRNAGLSGERSAVNKLTLKRDIGTFSFDNGSFFWMAPVNGKVTGAVFLGSGTLEMTPVLDQEKKSLSFLTKENAFKETFEAVVLRFTDTTYDEVKKAAGVSTGAVLGQNELNDIKNALRTKIHFNVDGRILQDVLSPQPGRLFYAFIRGQKYDSKEIFVLDPFGVPYFQPEEVMFQTWNDNKFGFWVVEHFAEEYRTGTAKGSQLSSAIKANQHTLDTAIEKSGKLDGDATTYFAANVKGLVVVPLNLFSTLRVTSVTGQQGEALDFIQEGKDDDPDFYVILPRPFDLGEKYSIRTVYSGKDAVSNEGGGNYFPIARSDWYPSTTFGDYASYKLIFHVPKGMKMAATGELVNESNEGNENVTTWQSVVPQAVAGFNFGQFKRTETKLPKENYVVEAYANQVSPDWLNGLKGGTTYEVSESRDPYSGERGVNITPTGAVGTLSTTSLMEKALAEGQLSIQLYTDYFGPAPYKHVAMTQQSACNFGQSWPGLVYLPLCSYLDSTTRHALFQKSMSPSLTTYFKVVAPHEVAHQWWGHTVGFNSYRDQWMSEGFAHFSASLFLQMIQKNDKEYIQFWDDLRRNITDRNKEGYRAIDVGPVTQGFRINNSRSGFNVYRNLIYDKGGYILHMVRMMMWNNKTGDKVFKETMRDFTTAYANHSATTEDFKAMVEKHMTEEMDLDGNHKMDWFFNEFVYGTALPSYKFEQSIQGGELYFKITQSNVTPDFKMLVPVYLDYGNGRLGRLGSATLVGNSSQEARVPIGKMKDQPKRAVLNYYDDVLASMDK